MNSYPLLLVIDHECSREQLNEAARVIEKTLSERLYRPNPNSNSMEHLPSLKDLMGRVLLMSASNLKQLRGRDKESESSEYNRVVSLLQSKLDFERKGQCCWNYCRMESAEVAGYEDVEDENIADYTKKIMVQT